MNSPTTDLAPTTTNMPLPHLACIEDHFSVDKWRECIDAMVGLVKGGSESVKVRAFEALTKVVEISEAARADQWRKPVATGGTLSLAADVTINLPGGGNGVIDVKAKSDDELEEMMQRARDGLGPDDD